MWSKLLICFPSIDQRDAYLFERHQCAGSDALRKIKHIRGYTNSPLDNCLFHKITTAGKIFFCAHVDNFAIAASSPELIEELCIKLKEKYIITESDSLESFLGVHMERHDGCLYLSQPGLIAKLITAAGIEADTHVYHKPMREDFSDEFQGDESPAWL